MPRLAKSRSFLIARRYGPWLREELDRIGVTLGQIAYLTRPHVSTTGSELSHSNLKGFVSGSSAPTFTTVIRIQHLLAQISRDSSSTLCALSHSYPEIITRIILGLDFEGLKEYWRIRSATSQDQHRRLRWRLQRRYGNQGFKALHRLPDYVKRKDRYGRLVAEVAARIWITRLAGQRDLLAIAIAYAYFGPYYGDTESMEMRAVFDEYDASREAAYTSAFERYCAESSGRAAPSESYAHDVLAQAERLLMQATADDFRVASVASPLFGVWANAFASDFVATVPLLAWIDDETLRSFLEVEGLT
jgi:hypothetical protein